MAAGFANHAARARAFAIPPSPHTIHQGAGVRISARRRLDQGLQAGQEPTGFQTTDPSGGRAEASGVLHRSAGSRLERATEAPLASSTSRFRLISGQKPQLRSRAHQLPTSPNLLDEFTGSGSPLFSSRCASTWSWPAPRKPVTTVTAGAAGLCWWSSQALGLLKWLIQWRVDAAGSRRPKKQCHWRLQSGRAGIEGEQNRW